jgi:glycosyltransferase 2 family protein
MASKTQDTLKTVLKLGIGFGLVAYVLRSKMIDFKALESVLFDPLNLVAAITFLFLTSFLCSVRWWLLAQTQGLRLNTWVMFQLTMIGNFFNTFMPGAVGGDVIKAWYVAGREPKNKGKAILSVIVDRALGLSIFIFYAAVALIFYFPSGPTRPEFLWLAWSVWGITAGGAMIVLMYFFSVGKKIPLVPRLRSKLDEIGIIKKLLDAGRLYRDRRLTVFKAAIISAISFTTMILFFKFEGNMLGVSLSLGQYFFVVPLAMVVSAIPLLPGGIGVGQVAFYTLFQWLGHPEPQQGATLCTLFQIYTILFNCLGAFFYIRFRRKPEAANQPERFRVGLNNSSALV